MGRCAGCREIFEKEIADKCKEWCRTHNSCNLNYIENSVKNLQEEKWKR